MNQVLILTRNILTEQDIQQKLQLLNYEVYCSASFFEQCTQQSQTLEFFRFFQYVILSESICESEVTELLPILQQQSVQVIRKVEAKVTELDHQYLEDNLIQAIISNEDSIDELRECLFALKRTTQQTDDAFENRKFIQLSDKVSLIRPSALREKRPNPEENYQYLEVIHHLSQTEMKILSILIHAGSSVVTRETICHQIWNEEVNKSHLASLSSTITRIKSKFENTSLANKAIQTLWGKGYRLNPELLDRIQNNEAINRIVSNG
ncbi:helix-turn-helix domain-containing protein [Enterococcus sp. AZ007]|uniref:helix-turn-helix domain-containing protein n=1 Tax=Enterococcus sp. AZ007 TaxID=2774839 RepID=UPI003F25DAAE